MVRSPHEQGDVEDEVVKVLRHGRITTTQEVTKAVKSRLVLAPGDLERANKRDSETKIDQIIANALQEGRRLCKSGLIERTGRGEFRITPTGHRYLADQAAMVAEMSADLDKLLPDAKWD